MVRTISITEAKNTFGAVLEWAVENNEGVIIESRGKPKAALLSYTDYQEFLTFRKQARRKGALRQLEELTERIWACNADLTSKEVEQLTDEISRETIHRMIDEGKISFQ